MTTPCEVCNGSGLVYQGTDYLVEPCADCWLGRTLAAMGATAYTAKREAGQSHTDIVNVLHSEVEHG